ncbi:hypothetical protein PsYK624_136720 [Phanerochaete sordida]|uniref:Uncharacterized protein n=1 Tax=Phanerochaete sordida TaxID=48140 RepID=A0A9P3LJK6_9APHY|nr:hypothetical protein PsYK624_136720 [Phanerochaete sordida]
MLHLAAQMDVWKHVFTVQRLTASLGAADGCTTPAGWPTAFRDLLPPRVDACHTSNIAIRVSILRSVKHTWE